MDTTTNSDETLAITGPDTFVAGRSPRPVHAGRGRSIGAGTVYPQLNFPLPSLPIASETMAELRHQHADIVEKAPSRAVVLTLSAEMIAEVSSRRRVRRITFAASAPLRAAPAAGELSLAPPELRSFERLSARTEALPADEEVFLADVLPRVDPSKVRLEEDDLEGLAP